MGSCFSLEGGGIERIAPAQRLQIPDPKDEQVEPTAVPSEPVIPVVLGSRSPAPGNAAPVLARFFGSAACYRARFLGFGAVHRIFHEVCGGRLLGF